MLNLVWKEIYMCKILYLTGGNIEDKSTRQITCDEAQKILLEAQKGKKNYNPICSMMDYRDNRLYRKIIYFTFQLVAIDLDTTKQIWYEKVNGDEYFIDKIVYNNYQNKNVYIELYFRNSKFSKPNICMIRMKDKNGWRYFVGDIEDIHFYRTIKFGDIEIVFKDLDASFEAFLNNVQECDKRFVRDDESPIVENNIEK